MAPRILDTDRLIMTAAVVNWTAVLRRQGADLPLAQLQRERRLKTAAQVQLRWLVNPATGLPTQPFQVWTRPHAKGTPPKGVTPSAIYQAGGGRMIYGFAPPLGYLQGRASNAGAGAALIVAYSGAPYSSAVIDVATLAPGVQSFWFSGKVGSLVVSPDVTLSDLRGLDGFTVANDKSWQRLEIVGLPIRPSQWADTFSWNQDQGMNAATMDPVDAALDRYRRGAPFLGWPDPVAAGFAAPPWFAPDPKAIVDTMQVGMLEDLRTMIRDHAPTDQINFRTAQTLPLQGGGSSVATNFAPISTLLLGAASDPQSSLIAGFGTAYEFVPPRPDRELPSNLSGDDYMVTAFYEKGLDGSSEAVEYAAVVFSPGPALPPPAPGHLVAQVDGLATPDAADGLYRALNRMSWDMLPQATPFRIASYAAARVGIVPAQPVVALMRPRQSDPKSLQPISATTSAAGAATGRLQAADDTYPLDPSAAANQVRYGIAQQDPYGVWSAWSTADASPASPGVQRPRLLAARLDLAAPPSAPGSVCAATLVVEVSWDWTVRRPRAITLFGRLYPAAKPGDPPVSAPVPAGLAKSLAGGPGAAFVLSFNGADAPGVTGGSVQYISDDAKSVLATPVVVAGPRRYRITIPGFQLDFAATGHIGLALWAQGQEQLPPQNTGSTLEPFLTSASDPRPPVITAQHEDVELASLADARGEHRARLDWPAMGGASGYFVYHATESQFRIAAGLGEPPSSQTLAERLLALRNAFEANPRREPFTRLNSTALTGTSTEVVIERGSKELHLYLVIGVSAGLIESAWPTLADAARRKRFQAFAAPQVVVATTPRLEVVRGPSGAGFGAKVMLTTRPGATVTRLDLFRTRVPAASLELDTMGPPAARIAGAGPVWQVKPTISTAPGAAQSLGVVTGVDVPGGSWKRVYYRAVAVAGDDPVRGLYGGRSAPTGAVWVIVPPDGEPDVSALAADWPGGALQNVRFTFTSPVPAADTDLGPHRLRVEAFTLGADGMLAPLFAWPASAGADDRLAAVPVTAPAAAGLWRDGMQYRVLLTRPALGDAVRLRILLTDPLGRATQRTLDSPGATPLPAPTIDKIVTTSAGASGTIVGFDTDALFTATALGPYMLRLQAVAKPVPIRPRRPTIQTTALPMIEPLRARSDPFGDSAALPLRRQGSHVTIYLRPGLASLQLTLTAPDGQTAQATVELP